MIRILLLAVVPFMTQHRNVVPKTEVSTNFYGSVTGIVDKAYIEARVDAHGGGAVSGCDTNAVIDIANSTIATNPVVAAKIDGPTVSPTNTAEAAGKAADAKLTGIELTNRYTKAETDARLAGKANVVGQDDIGTGNESIAGVGANGEILMGQKTIGEIEARADEVTEKADRPALPVTSGNLAALTADGNLADSGIAKDIVLFSSTLLDNPITLSYGSGEGLYLGTSYNDGPWGHWLVYGVNAPWFIERNGQSPTDPREPATIGDISATNPTFSSAVLAVGLNIDTNSVAVLNEIASTFGGFPIEGTATTVGGLLAALAAAIAWLKKNKVQTLKLEDESIVKTADNGVAKLDDFFTESNSLLNGRLSYSRNATGLKDRAFNTLSFDGTEYNLSTALAAVTPTASGQPRDLLIVATATAATTISFTAGTIKGDKPTIDGSGTWLITLTEYASGVWYCRQIKMEDAA